MTAWFRSHCTQAPPPPMWVHVDASAAEMAACAGYAADSAVAIAIVLHWCV